MEVDHGHHSVPPQFITLHTIGLYGRSCLDRFGKATDGGLGERNANARDHEQHSTDMMIPGKLFAFIFNSSFGWECQIQMKYHVSAP